jgi:hypothetical protein
LPSPVLVRPDVPDHVLLQDALDITAWQHSQRVANFTALPVSRPKGLTRLLVGGGGDAVLDTYHLTSGLIVVVAFSSARLTVCDAKGTGILCVRDEQVPGFAEDSPVLSSARTQEGEGALRHVTVYLTRPSGTVGKTEPDAVEAAGYWSAVRFVPAPEASWFTQLVAKARVSTVGS